MLGLGALFMGADGLCRGASSLALRLKIRPIIVGLTIVSVATSLPEMITSLAGALQSSPGIALGNIIGSNLVNGSLILGIAALINPITVQNRLVRKEIPLLILVTIVFSLFCYTGMIERWMGYVLLVCLFSYIIFLTKQSSTLDKAIQNEYTQEISHCPHSPFKSTLLILGGSLLLALGAELTIRPAVEMAQRLGVNDLLVGLTVVAIGTSLPELAASIIAAKRGQSDLCIGNIVGSNLFNILLIGGGVSAIIPLEVNASLGIVEIPALLIMTFVLSLLCLTHLTITRLEGALLLMLYVFFMILSGFSQMGLL